VITTINGRAEALIKIKVGGKVLYEKSRGVGPVHALDLALRKALRKFFDMDDVKLVNYKVRILNEEKATAATVEVFIEFKANSDKWYTIASSSNIIKASGEALVKGYKYYLLRRKDKILTS
jgi:2-isopropylmalate synthase